MWFARLAVGRAGNVQIAQVRPAEGHHSWVLDRKFDDPIQSSVRRVSVKAPAAMYCAPVEPLLVERAAVWNSKVFRYLGSTIEGSDRCTSIGLRGRRPRQRASPRLAREIVAAAVFMSW